MALVLDACQTRIDDILTANRGGTGMSSAAQAIAIPAGMFRVSEHRAPLSDPAYPMTAFDKAYEIDWQGSEWPVLPDNIDGSALLDLPFDLTIGIVYGDQNTNFVDTNGWTLTTANQVRVAKKFAVGLAYRVTQALTYPEIVTDPNTDPAIFDCQPGATRIVDLGEGRLLAVTRYTMRVKASTIAAYNPTISS